MVARVTRAARVWKLFYGKILKRANRKKGGWGWGEKNHLVFLNHFKD